MKSVDICVNNLKQHGFKRETTLPEQLLVVFMFLDWCEIMFKIYLGIC